MNYVIEDHRTDKEKQDTIGFVVANDVFRSKFIEGKSIVARPVRTIGNDSKKILSLFRTMNDFKYVRYVSGTRSKNGRIYKPKMRSGDHLVIYGFYAFTAAAEIPWVVQK